MVTLLRTSYVRKLCPYIQTKERHVALINTARVFNISIASYPNWSNPIDRITEKCDKCAPPTSMISSAQYQSTWDWEQEFVPIYFLAGTCFTLACYLCFVIRSSVDVAATMIRMLMCEFRGFF